MVIDGFTFFNELDLLEIRLNELDSVVDSFVLVEATKTHSNQPKPLYFEENKSRFEKFLPKIKHVVVDLPEGDDPWEREKFQRQMVIDRGFNEFPALAIGMVSDADEIPSALIVSTIEKSLREAGQAISVMQLFCYYHANRLLTVKDQAAYWAGTRIAQVHAWKGKQGREGTLKQIHGGWHLSYLGGTDAVQYKLKSYAHHKDEDHRDLTPEKISECIAEGFPLLHHRLNFTTTKLDIKFWPQYLQDNQDKFSHLIWQ